MTTLNDESKSDASKELDRLMREYYRSRDSANSSVTGQILGIIQEHPELSFQENSKGELLLHKAVECHAPTLVLEAIVQTNPDAVDKLAAGNGQTPLHRACLYATSLEPNAFKLLASKTAASTKCSLGYLPIHFYCDSQGKYEVDLSRLKVLVNAYPESVQQLDREGRPPLFLACRGASFQNFRAIQYLVQQYPQAIPTRDWFGFNILHLACTGSCTHSLQVIQYLVERHPKSARESSYYGSSPLHLLLYEASHDVSEIARFLMDLHPESVTLLDSDDCTPLHMFLHVGSNRGYQDLRTLRLIVNAYPDALAMVNSCGRTPLHLLCHVENDYVSVDILRYFLKYKYCRQILESDSGNMPILHMICSRSNHNKHENLTDLVQTIAISKTSVQVRNGFGETALHLLCRQGALPETCRVLLEKCPELVSAQDHNGVTPLHVAVKTSCSYTCGRYDQTITCLLEYCPRAVQVVDGNGVTPLFAACEEYAPLGIIYQLVRVDPMGLLEKNVERDKRMQSQMMLKQRMKEYENVEFELQRNKCICCVWSILI
jgi:ankyrin repeat protein